MPWPMVSSSTALMSLDAAVGRVVLLDPVSFHDDSFSTEVAPSPASRSSA